MNFKDIGTPPTEATYDQDARARYVRAAVDALRPTQTVGQYSVSETPSEVSDVIYLADYIERGAESHWLQSGGDK